MLAYTFARIRGTVHFRVTKGNHKKKITQNCPSKQWSQNMQDAHDVMGKEGFFPYSNKSFLAA